MTINKPKPHGKIIEIRVCYEDAWSEPYSVKELKKYQSILNQLKAIVNI